LVNVLSQPYRPRTSKGGVSELACHHYWSAKLGRTLFPCNRARAHFDCGFSGTWKR
jgi:hypothetical protein